MHMNFINQYVVSSTEFRLHLYVCNRLYYRMNCVNTYYNFPNELFRDTRFSLASQLGFMNGDWLPEPDIACINLTYLQHAKLSIFDHYRYATFTYPVSAAAAYLLFIYLRWKWKILIRPAAALNYNINVLVAIGALNLLISGRVSLLRMEFISTGDVYN